jgi:hypothetical protein
MVMPSSITIAETSTSVSAKASKELTISRTSAMRFQRGAEFMLPKGDVAPSG